MNITRARIVHALAKSALYIFGLNSKNQTIAVTAADLRGTVSVMDYGAVADGVNDDIGAIEAAIAALPNGGEVIFPPGVYRTTGPITITTRGITLRGAGFRSTSTPSGATRIVADHLLGAVIRTYAHETRILDMTIAASSSRTAGSMGDTVQAPNCGIHIEAQDAAGGSGAIQRIGLFNLAIQRQPSHGLLVSGLSSVFEITNVHSSYNGGHGMVFDRGSITGRVNTGYCGITNITACRSHDNGGHFLLLGNPDDDGFQAYRFRVVNMEGFRNGTNPDILLRQAFLVICGQNHTFENNAFGAEDPAVEEPLPMTGVWVAGRMIKFINNRYIKVSQPAIVGVAAGGSTRDIEFNGMFMGGPNLPFANAVDVESGATQVRVIVYANARGVDSQYVNPMPKTVPGYWSQESDGLSGDFGIEMRDFSSSPQLRAQADTAYTMTFDGITAGILVISSQSASDVSSIISFKVGSGAYCVGMVLGSDTVVGTGALTDGTSDGVNNVFNIHAAEDFKLYLKNRNSGERVVRITILASTTNLLAATSW